MCWRKPTSLTKRCPVGTDHPLRRNDVLAGVIYRRAWDALGLVHDIPGIWNPEKFDKPAHDGSSGDLAEDPQYKDYSDWADLNTPAELIVVRSDLDAYREITDGYEVHVLSRKAECRQGEDNEAVAYGDSTLATSEWLVNSGVPSHCFNKEIDPLLWQWNGTPPRITDLYVPTNPPATVLLVSETEGRTLSNRRSRSPRCLMAEKQRPLSVAEIVDATAIPRRTIYNWIQKGKLLKLGEGEYWCLCHVPPDL